MDRLRYLLGILTLVVMAAGGWFLFDRLESADLAARYQVEVTFLDARGLKPGADIKFRGIQVGTVRRIDVEEHGTHAVVLATIADDKVGLVRTNSRFWIVTPRFHGISSGVTGLDFLVFTIASVLARGLRFLLVTTLLWYFGEPIRGFIERHLGKLTVVFFVLLLGGFVIVKYLV